MTKTHENGCFERVYRRSYSTIYRFAKRLCRSTEDAEDITQETFSRAYRAMDSFQNDRPIENWLMRIAHNAFLDLRRKQARRLQPIHESALTDDRGLESIEDPNQSPEDAILRSEMDPGLASAMRELDPDARNLILMAHVEQLPYHEIAKSLGLKVATVRSRLHRACRKLRQLVLLKNVQPSCQAG